MFIRAVCMPKAAQVSWKWQAHSMPMTVLPSGASATSFLHSSGSMYFSGSGQGKFTASTSSRSSQLAKQPSAVRVRCSVSTLLPFMYQSKAAKMALQVGE